MKNSQDIKQKCLGVILLAIGILAMILFPEDATAGFFVSLMAFCLILCKPTYNFKK